MKTHRDIKLFFTPFLLLLGVTACDFEEINTKRYEVTAEQQQGDNAFIGSAFTQMETKVIPAGPATDNNASVNDYQLSDHLAGEVWAGYFGENNNWNSGLNHITFFLVDGWVSAAYDRMYRDIFTPWLKVKQYTNENDIPQLFALAQILKISAWHRAADTFGPIQYKNLDKGTIQVPYNSQKEVYQSFFEDLTESIQVLTEYGANGDKIVPSYDAVYAGDVTKWIKYANSLMLRLAMRVVYADPAMAKKYAEQAISHPMGVMTAKEDAAKMSQGAGISFRHPIVVLSEDYNEARMGSAIYSFLVGYDDPRLPKYFNKGSYNKKEDYYAIPAGSKEAKNETYTAYSKPNITADTPLYWLRASEVLFLKAEGALRGWNMGGGTPQSYYEEGVKMSFEENSVSGADNYLKNNADTPNEYTDPKTGSIFNVSTDLTIAWNNGDNMEKKLERIITQKWLALFPQGQEAWSEWRRTGYPKMPLYNGNSLVVNNSSGGVIDSKRGIRRMNYPSSQYVNNKESVLKAVSLLGGPDTGATRLWWDKK